MAIGIRANGTWTAAAQNSQSNQIAIPGTPQAGDLMLLAATIKPYTFTPSVDQGWQQLINESGGTTSNGNGAGSTTLCVFYKVHDGTAQTDPTVTWSGASSPGQATIVVLSKASNEGWNLQQLSAATETAMGTTALSTDLTTTVAIQNGDWVWALVGVGDDSATFTRATTAISGAAVTWNGNYVEEPVDHSSTTNGNDGAADLGYRAVTTGTASGATLTVTATLSAAERVNSVLFRVGVDAQTTQNGSLTANAVARRTQAGSFTASAVIQRTVTMAPSHWRANNAHSFNNSIRKVSFDGTYFVAVAYAQTGFHILAHTTNPEQAWTDNTSPRDNGAFDLRWVHYANGVWVAVGNNSGATAKVVMTATDPTGTWTLNGTSFANGDLKTVHFGNGRWVAAGNGPKVYTTTSPTGTWTENTDASIATLFNDIRGVHYANGVWVAVGIRPGDLLGRIAYATDPTGAWTEATFDTTGVFSNSGLWTVEYAAGYWVVGGYWDNTNKVIVATDPTGTWTSYETAFVDDLNPDPSHRNGNAGPFGNGKTWVLTGGWDNGTGVHGQIQYTSSNPTTGWTKATDDGGQFTGVINARNLVRSYYAAPYWIAVGDSSGGDTPSAMMTTREYLASAVLAATQAGSFSADAVIESAGGGGTIEGGFTADARADLVGVPFWVSPANEDPITANPTLVFTIPEATGKVWFNLQLDTVDTFDGPNLRDIKTTTDQTGWEFFNGSDWEAVPADGIPGTAAGQQARYSVSPSLPSGTWYRRVRAGTTR